MQFYIIPKRNVSDTLTEHGFGLVQFYTIPKHQIVVWNYIKLLWATKNRLRETEISVISTLL